MSADHHLASSPPPIERKQITLPALGAIGVILALCAMGRLNVVLGFIAIAVVAFVCSQIRSSENRAHQQQVSTAYYEAQRVQGERDYYDAQRRYFEEHGQYFDPHAVPMRPLHHHAPVVQTSGNGWGVAATVLAVIAVIGGLAFLAVVVLILAAFSQSGSNK